MSRTDTDRREYGGYGLNFYWLLHPRRLIAARRPNMSQKLSIATADTHLYTVDNSGGTPPLLFLNGGWHHTELEPRHPAPRGEIPHRPL
jgi:hypothetical protein